MLLFILIIAVINLALGFGLAHFGGQDQPVLQLPRLRVPRLRVPRPKMALLGLLALLRLIRLPRIRFSLLKFKRKAKPDTEESQAEAIDVGPDVESELEPEEPPSETTDELESESKDESDAEPAVIEDETELEDEPAEEPDTEPEQAEAAATEESETALDGLVVEEPVEESAPAEVESGGADDGALKDQSGVEAVTESPADVDAEGAREVPAEVEAEKPSEPEVSDPFAIPQAWKDRLVEKWLEPGSFMEAAVEMLLVEADDYRRDVVVLERHIRESFASDSEEPLLQHAQSLMQRNAHWLATLQDLGGYLQPACAAESAGGKGSVDSILHLLDDEVLDQLAQTEKFQRSLESLAAGQGLSAMAGQVGVELSRQLDSSNLLRDKMYDTMVTLLKDEGRMDCVQRSLQFDADTDLFNRVGLENLVEQWWRDDPERARPASVIHLDIDRFHQINSEVGAANGDALLQSFANILRGIIRQNRGFDRAGRFSGQSFLLFLGDTNGRNATSAAERIRQMIEATSFEIDGKQHDLTVSCGITQLRGEDTTSDVMQRATAAAQEAKGAGRNRSAIHVDGSLAIVEPPQYQVKGQIIQIG